MAKRSKIKATRWVDYHPSMKEHSKVLVGWVGVDSGQIMVCDPCNAGELSDYDAILREREKKSNFGVELGYLGVVTNTNYGDGTYPVYATIFNGAEGVIKRLTVEFLPPRERNNYAMRNVLDELRKNPDLIKEMEEEG